MTPWTAGYVLDIPYTHGFYRELTPAMLGLVPLVRGQTGPAVGAPLTYCELGCGQGFSTNLLAAANPQIQFHATDFNPTQIAGARALAAEAGTSNLHFYDHAFAEFIHEPGLPEAFDIIALHGIYSWISPENRAHIVEFIRRKLKVGGLVYASYNTLPGWASAMPLRRLLVDHAATQLAPTTLSVESALAFVDKLQMTSPLYFTQNPSLGPRMEKLKGQVRSYLAHEYFNRDWTPFYFKDVTDEFAEAKLTFVGSANFLDHIDAINLTDEQLTLLGEVADVVRREGLRDYMVNQQFRRDIFIRGPVPHTNLSSRESWLDMRFALSTLRVDVPLKVMGARGEATLHPESYEALLDGLAKGPTTLRQLLADPRIAALGWGKIMQALTVLVGGGHLQPALPLKDEAKRTPRTRAFNMAMCERAKASADLTHLASPVTGGGVAVDRFGQLFLLARTQKEADPVLFAWKILDSQGQRLLKGGKALETPEDNLAELRELHVRFTEKQLPVLQQLGIA